jgi:hypothetical protein
MAPSRGGPRTYGLGFLSRAERRMRRARRDVRSKWRYGNGLWRGILSCEDSETCYLNCLRRMGLNFVPAQGVVFWGVSTYVRLSSRFHHEINTSRQSKIQKGPAPETPRRRALLDTCTGAKALRVPDVTSDGSRSGHKIKGRIGPRRRPGVGWRHGVGSRFDSVETLRCHRASANRLPTPFRAPGTGTFGQSRSSKTNGSLRSLTSAVRPLV